MSQYLEDDWGGPEPYPKEPLCGACADQGCRECRPGRWRLRWYSVSARWRRLGRALTRRYDTGPPF